MTQMTRAPRRCRCTGVVVGLGGVTADVRRYSNSPLLEGERYWRKVLLVMTHRRQVREAALREEVASGSRREKE